MLARRLKKESHVTRLRVYLNPYAVHSLNSFCSEELIFSTIIEIYFGFSYILLTYQMYHFHCIFCQLAPGLCFRLPIQLLPDFGSTQKRQIDALGLSFLVGLLSSIHLLNCT